MATKNVSSKSSTAAAKTSATPAKKVQEKSLEKSVDAAKPQAKAAPAKAKSISQVSDGHLVSVDYTGTLANGEEFDSSKEHGPIQFVVGAGQVIKGFDNAVRGMKVNESKKFTIPKTEAYGDVNPAMVQKVPIAQVPEHIRKQLKVGGFLVMQSPHGQQMPAKVLSVTKEHVELDMNHPLAGKDLSFAITVRGISQAPEQSEDDCCGGGCCGHEDKGKGKKKSKGDDCCGGNCGC